MSDQAGPEPDSDQSKPDLEESTPEPEDDKPDSDQSKPDPAESKPDLEKVKPDPEEASAPDAKKVARVRCAECKKRLNITNMYTCRCGQMFCAVHRHCEAHHCSFDYKSHGRRQIQEANPFVGAPKLPKI